MVVNKDGDIIWYGIKTNWKKTKNGKWTILGEDENIKPTETFYDINGNVDGYSYPNGRLIWIECGIPIYEKMYKELQSN